MKKKIITILLCVTAGLSITACGGSKAEKSSSVSAVSAESAVEAESAAAAETEADAIPLLDKEEYTLDECITLGEYKNLELTKTVKPVTDGQVLLKISQQTNAEGEELTDKDAAVQEGDTAVIEYVGKKDGVAFEGGTSTEPYGLQIGSGSFIDGFEDGVIGMKAGETKDLNLTFPENYQATELAGQDVVFTVTVNSIKRLNITDEWVKENAGSDFANAEEYLESFRSVLKEQNETEAENALKAEAWGLARDNSTYLALPKSLVDKAAEAYEKSASQQAEMYGYELEDMINAYGKEKYEEEKSSYAQSDAKNSLLMQAVMAAEGIEKDGDEYKTALDELVKSVGAESADELISSYGQDEIDDMVLQTIVVEKILSYANITEA